jgi:protocatechuate 3,4-dioxygenase, beta subunit
MLPTPTWESDMATQQEPAGQAKQILRRTPDQILGPFYPLEKPVDRGGDLTRIPGKPGRAEGQIIHLMGRVFDLKGQPLQGVRVEIWQANAHGRYVHASDPNPAPIDPNFEGFGVQVTDREGRYRFKTVRPMGYPTQIEGWQRPPHIHFDVTGKIDKLVTQMYFEGDPLNAKDRLLQSSWAQERLIARLLPATGDVEPESQLAVWDIVIPRG